MAFMVIMAFLFDQSSFGMLVNASTSGRAMSRCAAILGKLAGDGVDEPLVLDVDGGGVGLVIDRVQQRLDPGPGRLRYRGHQVRYAVEASGFNSLAYFLALSRLPVGLWRKRSVARPVPGSSRPVSAAAEPPGMRCRWCGG